MFYLKRFEKSSIQLKERISYAEILFIKNVGHEVNLDTPEELGEMLNEFLNRNEIMKYEF